ncbi:MAG: hypothetical protein IPL65_06980 [Lewinellaceae bacterium]|nr:hypothetical protein [Lewinellaceae bacterium]
MPTVVRKDIDNNSAKITVTILREEIQPKVDAELKRFRQRAGIKGFRQGQVPMAYVKKMFGSSLLVDTFNDMMSQEIYNYLKESQLDVLGQPLPAEDQHQYSFKIDSLEPEYAVVYDVGFVNPFEVQGLDKAQKFERYTIADIDDLAGEDLDYARNRMGKRSNPENDIQDNDIVRIKAKEVDGDYETTITVYVKNVTDEAFRSELLGKKKGDSIRFNARTVEEQQEEHMYRKYILSLADNDERQVNDWFEGEIEEVSRVEKADLDEEFYKSYFGGKVNSETEAIDEIKKGIQNFYEVRANALLMRDFQDRLMELNKIELPTLSLSAGCLYPTKAKSAKSRWNANMKPLPKTCAGA